VVSGPASADEDVAVATATERRLVSVLFADLVGFTTLSEGRDAEEVRDLLSQYFETCRSLIERYGGTVGKFIGDAVMAVWGAPVAKEDDAERAVRTALDLVQAVADMGADLGAPNLRARAGVLTGEAAVMPGGNSQGLVVGDLVNTASRLQSIAEPGTVVVGDSTKRASEAAIAYEDAGVRELKGKAEPSQLWRALRVVAGSRGSQRSSGLEAPFVGRDRELRMVKELFHASAEERRAQLLSIAGIAGIGKSRLAWEFEKYVDGLAADVWWHRGRCLSYGEGIAYWALAEMVRMRCDIVEDEEPGSALRKLHSTLEAHVPEADEQRWVEPRLAHLLGLEEGPPGDQENLFSAWRIFFERLAERSPTVLVFEDMQWADEGLLDFLEYLLEWSRSHALFVLVLARPELAERRSGWGGGKRSFASLHLEALPAGPMSALLAGLVPGLPEELRQRILDRAEGIPLYAVETVRMLLDRGLLVREGNVYTPAGLIETLEVPETLHALVASRLDNLAVEERRLVQDGAVLGKTFTKHGLVALTGRPESEIEPILAALVRKELLSIQADPRSPERGQYTFLQDIVKRIAYETISKRDRKAKHLAAAAFLVSVWSAEEDEIAELVATHYLDAYEAAPSDPDAGEIRTQAGKMLVRAAERAASLAANAEAQSAFERAIELTDDALTHAQLHERAGMSAYMGTRTDDAAAHWERSIELFEAAGATHPAARVSARLAEVMWDRGRLEAGLESMERSLTVLSGEGDEPDDNVASLAAQVGRFLYFAGHPELALQRIESALELAEKLALPEVFSQALNTRAIILQAVGRRQEAGFLLRHALEVALEYDKPSAALRAYYNLADDLSMRDRYEESLAVAREGLALSRKVGNRYWEWLLLGFGYPCYARGEWDEVLAKRAALPEDDWTQARIAFSCLLNSIIPVCLHRGLLDEARQLLELAAELEQSADVQERGYYANASAALLLASGDTEGALVAAERAWAGRETLGAAHESAKEGFAVACEAAFRADLPQRVEELVATVAALPASGRSQLLDAQAERFRARLAARRGDNAEAERLFKRAGALLRELEVPFALAVVLLEHAEWLGSTGRPDEAEPFAEEACQTFERLGALPWLVRAGRRSSVAGRT
jgi:class 3 adenylate cyclase/tetratricopeptide (TPR) repeat protein